jgi:type I restriction enzyme S subunit
MSLTGTSGKEDYGFTVKVPEISKILLLNQRVAKIDIKSKGLLKDFLLYFLLSRKFLDFLYPTAKGMKQANLSTHAMKKLKILIPDVNEQEVIAKCFRQIDSKIQLHENQADRLQSLFRTLLNQLMTAQVRVNDIDLSELGLATEKQT